MTYRIDPRIAAFAAAVPDLAATDYRATRAAYDALLGAAPPVEAPAGLAVEDRTVPASAHAPAVPVRVYRPTTGSELQPALVYFHGGGFFVGNLEFSHVQCLQYADEARCVVISVDYRLAPEHPFPAALEDGFAALCWAHEHASELGIDRARIAVGGSSAGGGLAASTALLTRDRGGPALCFQHLVYPVLDDRGRTPSARRFVDTPILDRNAVEALWALYLSGLSGDEVPPTAAPARSPRLAGLPPAYVMAAELDPLCDEDVEYARRLQAEGVSTELHVIPNVPHGFVVARDAPVAARVRDEHVRVLREALWPADVVSA